MSENHCIVSHSVRDRRIGLVVVTSCACAALFTTPAMAQWKQWGGPNQDWKSDATDLASEWPADGPKRLWTREMGDGYSSILVDDGRLYTMYRTADDMETVIVLDASDGRTIWEHKYDAPIGPEHAKQFGIGPRSTPLLDDGLLYTIGVSGQMHCLDKYTGKVQWSHNLWKEYGGNVLEHGYSSSPFVYRDTVIVLVGGKDHSIMALNKKDGSVVWHKHDFANSYSTPKLINVDGEDQLAIFMAEEIIGISPVNGDLKWRYAHTNQWKQNVCLPTWGKGNYLFFSSPEAGSRALKLTRKGDETKIKEVWSKRKIQFYHVTSVGIGNYVYGSSGTMGPAMFAGINIKTGKIAWRKRGLAKATCVLADDKFIILDEDGNLVLATATPKKFTIHSKVQLLDKVSWTVPTIVGQTLYVRDKKNIMALDLSAANNPT